MSIKNKKTFSESHSEGSPALNRNREYPEYKDDDAKEDFCRDKNYDKNGASHRE